MVYLTEQYVDLFSQMPPAQLNYLHLKSYVPPHTLQHHPPSKETLGQCFGHQVLCRFDDDDDDDDDDDGGGGGGDNNDKR